MLGRDKVSIPNQAWSLYSHHGALSKTREIKTIAWKLLELEKKAGAGRTVYSNLFTFLMIAGRDLQIKLQLTEMRNKFWP